MANPQDPGDESHFDRWCRAVSRQPFRQFLRSHPHYARLRAEHRQTPLTPPTSTPMLPHKAPEYIGRPTLMLDLEGTLLACCRLSDAGKDGGGGGGDDWTGWEAMQSNPDADLILLLPETPTSFKRHKYAVYKRPGLDAFLAGLARLGFECVVYSTATMQMARSLVAQIDRDGTIAGVLARKACTLGGGAPSTSKPLASSSSRSTPLLFKDINAAGRDPARTLFVDDWPALCCANPENLLPVPPFSIGGSGDGNAEWARRQERPEDSLKAAELPLMRLLRLLERLAAFDGDVRDFLDQDDAAVAYRRAVASEADTAATEKAGGASA